MVGLMMMRCTTMLEPLDERATLNCALLAEKLDQAIKAINELAQRLEALKKARPESSVRDFFEAHPEGLEHMMKGIAKYVRHEVKKRQPDVVTGSIEGDTETLTVTVPPKWEDMDEPTAAT